MPLLKSDYEQAIRYLKGASEMMERSAAANTRGLRDLQSQLIQRLTPNDRLVAQLANDLIVMRQVATRLQEMGLPDAATEILKAVAVLRDKSR